MAVRNLLRVGLLMWASGIITSVTSAQEEAKVVDHMAVLDWRMSPPAPKADSSCNDEDPKTCCKNWTISKSTKGKPSGALLSRSFDGIMKDLAGARRVDKELCAYFRGDSSCDNSYSEPRCADDATTAMGAFRSLLKTTVKGQGRKAAKAWLRKQMQSLLKDAAKASGRIEALRNVISGYDPNLPGGVKPAQGLGSIVKEYQDNLEAGTERVQKLEREMQSWFPDDDMLLWAGGSYGGAFDIDGALRDCMSLKTATANANNIPLVTDPFEAIPLKADFGEDYKSRTPIDLGSVNGFWVGVSQEKADPFLQKKTEPLGRSPLRFYVKPFAYEPGTLDVEWMIQCQDDEVFFTHKSLRTSILYTGGSFRGCPSDVPTVTFQLKSLRFTKDTPAQEKAHGECRKRAVEAESACREACRKPPERKGCSEDCQRNFSVAFDACD